MVGGAAFMVHGVMVSYLSFFQSIPGMVASVLFGLWAFIFGLWAFIMAFLIWRYSRQPIARHESAR